MSQSQLRIGKLSFTRLTAQLTHHLHHRENSIHSRVAAGEASTIGIHRQLASWRDSPLGNKRPTLALLTETEIFEKQAGMYGIFPVVEVVRQLRGEAGERQLSDPQLGLAHGNGGVLSAQVTVILGTESTL